MHAPDRATELYDQVIARGLTAVAVAKDLSDRDRSLLRLIADVSRDALAQAVLGPEPVSADTKYYRMLKTPTFHTSASCPSRSLWANAARVEAYTVLFRNSLPIPLEEVVIFFQKKGHAIVEPPVQRKPFPAGGAHNFILGECPMMESYVIGVFVNGLYIKIPAGGDTHLTPADVSRFHPDDIYPCSDSWLFGSS